MLADSPFVGLMKSMVRILGPQYFEMEAVSPAAAATLLEVAFADVSRWPPPIPGVHLELPLLGEMIRFDVPWVNVHSYKPASGGGGGGEDSGEGESWRRVLQTADGASDAADAAIGGRGVPYPLSDLTDSTDVGPRADASQREWHHSESEESVEEYVVDTDDGDESFIGTTADGAASNGRSAGVHAHITQEEEAHQSRSAPHSRLRLHPDPASTSSLRADNVVPAHASSRADVDPSLTAGSRSQHPHHAASSSSAVISQQQHRGGAARPHSRAAVVGHGSGNSRAVVGNGSSRAAADAQPASMSRPLSLREMFAASARELPGLFQEIGLFSVFRSLAPCLWHMWELAITGQPILVMGPSPDICGDAVLAIVSLVSPLEYCADFRPYFTLFDPDFHAITAMVDAQWGRANPRLPRLPHSVPGRASSSSGGRPGGHVGHSAPPSLRHPDGDDHGGAGRGHYHQREEEEEKGVPLTSAAQTRTRPAFGSATPAALPSHSLAHLPTPPLLIGTTNPFFLKALERWPNAMWLGSRPTPVFASHTSGHGALGAGSSVASTPAGRRSPFNGAKLSGTGSPGTTSPQPMLSSRFSASAAVMRGSLSSGELAVAVAAAVAAAAAAGPSAASSTSPRASHSSAAHGSFSSAAAAAVSGSPMRPRHRRHEEPASPPPRGDFHLGSDAANGSASSSSTTGEGVMIEIPLTSSPSTPRLELASSSGMRASSQSAEFHARGGGGEGESGHGHSHRRTNSGGASSSSGSGGGVFPSLSRGYSAADAKPRIISATASLAELLPGPGTDASATEPMFVSRVTALVPPDISVLSQLLRVKASDEEGRQLRITGGGAAGTPGPAAATISGRHGRASSNVSIGVGSSPAQGSARGTGYRMSSPPHAGGGRGSARSPVPSSRAAGAAAAVSTAGGRGGGSNSGASTPVTDREASGGWIGGSVGWTWDDGRGLSRGDIPAVVINNAILRQHFRNLTFSFLRPFERYFRLDSNTAAAAASAAAAAASASALPRGRGGGGAGAGLPIAVSPAAAAAAAANASLSRGSNAASHRPQSGFFGPYDDLAASFLPRFEEHAFLAELERTGGPRHKLLAASKWRQLYSAFIHSPHFYPWFHARRRECLRSLYNLSRALRLSTSIGELLGEAALTQFEASLGTAPSSVAGDSVRSVASRADSSAALVLQTPASTLTPTPADDAAAQSHSRPNHRGHASAFSSGRTAGVPPLSTPVTPSPSSSSSSSAAVLPLDSRDSMPPLPPSMGLAAALQSSSMRRLPVSPVLGTAAGGVLSSSNRLSPSPMILASPPGGPAAAVSGMPPSALGSTTVSASASGSASAANSVHPPNPGPLARLVGRGLPHTLAIIQGHATGRATSPSPVLTSAAAAPPAAVSLSARSANSSGAPVMSSSASFSASSSASFSERSVGATSPSISSNSGTAALPSRTGAAVDVTSANPVGLDEDAAASALRLAPSPCLSGMDDGLAGPTAATAAPIAMPPSRTSSSVAAPASRTLHHPPSVTSTAHFASIIPTSTKKEAAEALRRKIALCLTRESAFLVLDAELEGVMKTHLATVDAFLRHLRQ